METTMKNYIQSGNNITLTMIADVLSGVGVLIGAIFGVVQGNALAGALCVLVRKGVFELPKTSAQAWTVGAKLYWDDTAKVVTTTVGTNILIGAAFAVAANPSATGLVLLDGTIR
jgi:predicted RecA/RadA family phage recombinase